MERLSPLDASFLYVEDGVTHMDIASCALFEGPAPTYGELVEAIGCKLDRARRYRQVVRFVPMQLGAPVWADDAAFDIEHHVHRSALPAPGGKAELCDLMGRLMSRELDRRRPLWEAWLVDGLEDGHWALITKIHHCMADGVSGTGLFAAILDVERNPVPTTCAPWEPEPQPSGLRLLVDAAAHLATSPSSGLRSAGAIVHAPVRVVERLWGVGSGIISYAGHLLPTAPNSLVGPIGAHRRWTWVSAELSDAKRIGAAYGVTINDVAIAGVTIGLREMLLTRDEPVDSMAFRSLVPVSVRTDGEREDCNNRVSAIIADLPVCVADPLACLLAVHVELTRLKASHQAWAGEGLTALLGSAPTALVALAERGTMELLRHRPQYTINTVTTNVAGPACPLYLLGRQMFEFLPFVPIAPGVRVGIAIVSYHGRLAFGITGDEDSAPDVDVLARGIENGLAALGKGAGSAG